MDRALTLDRVAKRFAGHTAVRELSLAVSPGIIYGLLGPNGAGKSTTLRMLMNIIARDAGEISIFGADPAADRRILRRVGYLPEERGLYKKMKARDVIVFFARLKGVDRRHAQKAADAWLERMGLAEWREARVETLSKGMQQKVQFITTVLHEPDLLVLDEPFSGLDPVNQQVLRETVLDARRQGRTVLFSTHIMEQAEKLCEEICIIARGEKVLEGDLRTIRRNASGRRYAVGFEPDSPEIERFLRVHRAVENVERRDGEWQVDLRSDADSRELVAELNRLPATLVHFARVEMPLHDIFVAHVGGAAVARRLEEAAHV